jgi:hypothetical protein
MSGQKTKKNREKRDLNIAPIVSPNVLKNKLLKRIKDHKTRELKYGQNANNNANSNSNANINAHAFSDEFHSAINYLSDITKKQKQQKIINSKTVKNYSNPISSIPENPYISLDLPPELAEPVNTYIPNEVFNVNYKSGEDIPYGCLKNGKKKTYREWKELTRAPELPDFVRPPTPPKKQVNLFLQGATPIEPKETVLTQPSLSREQRLEQIKNKLKKLQSLETQNKMKTMEDLNKIEKDFEMNKTTSNPELDELPDFDDTQMQSSSPDISELIENRQQKIEKETPKQYLKKTVKRKFTLGKSDKLRRVSILIKDKQTRKNIINTQKELKKTNITDVRKYLRQHGIIKVGSTCPPDILRKTFESALLAGEITNTNKETLLHNFINDDSSK